MTTPTLMPSPRQRFTDNNGAPLVGGMISTYAAGTSDLKAAFQDAAGTIPHANPIRLDARGEATVYWSGAYKVDAKNASGIQVQGYPVDNFKTNDSADVLAAALALPAGAAGIGMRRSFANAVSSTLALWFDANFVNLKSECGAIGDGVADDTIPLQRALATGLAVFAPDGTYKITSTITRTANNITIIGGGMTSCVFQYTGTTGIALDFVAAQNYLQTGRVNLQGFKVKTSLNDAKGTAYSTYTGQGIRLKYFHGGAIGPVMVEGFNLGFEMDTCYHNCVTGVSSVGCYRGLVLSGGSNGNVFNGGVHAASSIDLSAGGGNNTVNSVDIEPGARTNYLGDGNVYNSVRFERISLNIPINPWIDIGSDTSINGLMIPFDGTTIQPDGSFMVKVNGKRNVITAQSPYVHRNGFYFGLNSSDNWLTIAGDYNDNTNTGGVAYIASKQWIIDYGVHNRLTLVGPNGTTDTVGDLSQTIIGSVPNKCPLDIASWTLTNCTAAQPTAGYLGPMGAPIADLVVRMFTATGTDPSIDTGLLYTADGATVYSADCWVLIPNSAGVTGLTLRAVTNQGGHTIDTTATGKWLRLWQVGQPANGNAVRLILQATGGIGSQFLMALPRVGPGYASGYTPPNSTGSNAPLANFLSGKYAPVWTASGGSAAIGNGLLTGAYTRAGKQVTATMELSFGSTTNVGVGFYEFTLPSLCRTDKAWNCTGLMYDASTAINYVLAGYVNAPTGKVRLFPNGIAGVIGAAVPVVPATSDYLTFTISYEEA